MKKPFEQDKDVVTFIGEIISHTQKKHVTNDKVVKITIEYSADHETIASIDKLFRPEHLIKVTLEEDND